MIPAEYYLVLAALLFFIGVFGFFTRRNLLGVLISTELVLNAVDINFAVFNAYYFPEHLEGFFFTMFAIGIAASETAIAIAIILNVYRNMRTIRLKELKKLKF